MKYKNTSVTGDAGEHLFAYWIIKNFKTPCRLPEIDLGIDAEIEFTDENNHTTGEFIFAQIKSSNRNSYTHPIKLKNLYYWKSIDFPVILVGMNINEIDEIYWIHINDEQILDSYISKAEEKLVNTNIDKIIVSINIKKDGVKLNKNDKEKLSTLRFYKIIDTFEEYISLLESAVDFIIDQYEGINSEELLTDKLTFSPYYEVVSDYILKLDWLYTFYEKVKYIQTRYNNIVDNLTEYDRADIDILLKKANKAFEIIDYSYDVIYYFIKYKPAELIEEDTEIITQLSNYTIPIQSNEAIKLVNAVNKND